MRPHQGSPTTVTSAATSPARAPVPRQAARRSLSSRRLAPRRVVHTEPGTVPGEDAPGTGRRRFPDEPTDCHPPPPPPVSVEEPHEKKSTAQYYEEFPALVRSSFPLYVLSAGEQEPLGVVELGLEDAGPATRNRRRPRPVDTAPPGGPRVPAHPDTHEELQREVLSRKGC